MFRDMSEPFAALNSFPNKSLTGDKNRLRMTLERIGYIQMKNSIAYSASVERLTYRAAPGWGPRFVNFSLGRVWVTRGTLAVLDQGLISGSNFLIGILLARWLLPAQYGAYGLAFEIF